MALKKGTGRGKSNLTPLRKATGTTGKMHPAGTVRQVGKSPIVKK